MIHVTLTRNLSQNKLVDTNKFILGQVWNLYGPQRTGLNKSQWKSKEGGPREEREWSLYRARVRWERCLWCLQWSGRTRNHTFFLSFSFFNWSLCDSYGFGIDGYGEQKDIWWVDENNAQFFFWGEGEASNTYKNGEAVSIHACPMPQCGSSHLQFAARFILTLAAVSPIYVKMPDRVGHHTTKSINGWKTSPSFLPGLYGWTPFVTPPHPPNLNRHHSWTRHVCTYLFHLSNASVETLDVVVHSSSFHLGTRLRWMLSTQVSYTSKEFQNPTYLQLYRATLILRLIFQSMSCIETILYLMCRLTLVTLHSMHLNTPKLHLVVQIWIRIG